ncbi:polysaccharide biosynthesis/export family protein [Azospirillum sp. TSO22-1]|uniref:polysaccharide biosynthesis/export family protein n=1 Tax=Azospirillum sp. TSO22-1 TaxID=716789 RepID=UPI000D61E72F|nr:polysaccharide biosynthesis/export family protein [Azospirillum sp. TSO22-1]PWC52985.1 sugar ABC transporter substrate-binding protein [Azospirillum sp. TSO22-1]
MSREFPGRAARALLCVAMLAAALLAGCSSQQSFPTEEAPMKIGNPADAYVLEPGNRVRLIVFGENNLSGDFVVDPVGNVSLPLVGNVVASGVTAKTLAKRIEDLLRKDAYLQDPKVAVEVQTFRPFYVLGEVRQPGEFPYTTGMTVLSAIAKAGGYDYRAREGEVVLVRVIEGEQKEYRAVERAPILPGDIVRVLQRRF